MIKEKQTPKELKKGITLINIENKLALAKKIIAEKDKELAIRNKKLTELIAINNELTTTENILSEIKKLVDENPDNELSKKIKKILFKNTLN